MIRLSLAELQRLVERAAEAYAANAWESPDWRDDARRKRDAALAEGLRIIHLGTWAEALEKQAKIVTGD